MLDQLLGSHTLEVIQSLGTIWAVAYIMNLLIRLLLKLWKGETL
jgi:hypothetical protein